MNVDIQSAIKMEIKKVRKTYYLPDIGECVEAFDYEVVKWQNNENLDGVRFVLYDGEIVKGIMTLTPNQVKYGVVHKDETLRHSKVGGKSYYLWAFRWIPDDPNQLSLGI